jgi:signal peptidase I
VRETTIVPKTRAAGTKRRTLSREIVETIVLTLLIYFAVHFSIQPYAVDGPSMQPGLHTGEKVLVNLLVYDFGSPKRGDVIVFHPPTTNDPNLYYVKRVIAVPGDTIEISPTAVYVNGTLLHEPYIASVSGDSPFDQNALNPGVTPQRTLGKDQYWVMGDNRTNSVDSRFFGPISRQSIVGKADAVVWPLNVFQWLPDETSVFAGAGQ